MPHGLLVSDIKACIFFLASNLGKTKVENKGVKKKKKTPKDCVAKRLVCV